MLKPYDLLRAVLFPTFAFIIGSAIAQEQTINPDLATPSISSVKPSSSPGKSSMSVIPAGTVDLVEGDVRIYDGREKIHDVKLGDTVAEGDSIVTGKDGELHLNMDDGGFIAVRPNTRMSIVNFRAQGDNNDRSILSLLQGSFRSITGWIGKYRPSAYQIRTPTATIGVRGTDHEPLVIPLGASEGEPGTYDKVNAGGSYIQTSHGQVDVATGKAAFAPHSPKPGQEAPRLLSEVPLFFRPTRNEHLIENRHQAIQKKIEHLREERRKQVTEHRAAIDKPHAIGQAQKGRDEVRLRQELARKRLQQKLQQRNETKQHAKQARQNKLRDKEEHKHAGAR